MNNKTVGRILLSIFIVLLSTHFLLEAQLNSGHGYGVHKGIELTAVEYDRYFSPNGDGVKDVMNFKASFSGPHKKSVFVSLFIKKDDRWIAFRTGSALFTAEGKAEINMVWNGKDFSDQTVADGKYNLIMYYFDIPALGYYHGHHKAEKVWKEIEKYIWHKNKHELLKRWDGEVLVDNGTQVPQVNFTASPTTISQGESATLTWTSTYATAAVIDNGIGVVPAVGSKIVSPQQTTVYTITVTGPGGTNTASATVTVNLTQPKIFLKAFPAAVLPGEPFNLCWQTENADAVVIDNGVGTVAMTGSLQLSSTETITYTMSASGPGGTSNASVTVSIDSTLQPAVAIYATPEITAGAAVLCWTSLHAASASIDNSIGNVPLKGLLRVNPAQSTTFSITVANANGTALAAVKVAVKSSPRCYAYVPNFTDNTVSVIDMANAGNVVKTIAVGNQPKGCAVALDGTRVFIGNYSSKSISIIDTGSNTVISTIGIGGSPQYLALYPDGSRLYAAFEKHEPEITTYAIAVVDINNSQVVREIDLGSDCPGGIVVHPDGSRLYAAQRDRNRILVIDTAGNEIMFGILLRAPLDLAVSHDGKRLYAIQSSDGLKENISLVDTGTHAVLSGLCLTKADGIAASLLALKIHPDGSKLYVTAADEDSILLIDTATLQAAKGGQFSGISPVCLAVHPDGSRVYVVYNGSNFLAWYESVSGAIGSWVNVGQSPFGYGNFLGYLAETIAGKVSRNGIGVAGITMTVTGEGSTKTILTDSNGNYIVALKNGSYTITPSGSGYSFFPQSLQVNIEQSLSGQDFKIIDSGVAPTVSLSAVPAIIQAGESVTLSWASANAATAVIDNGIGEVPENGSITVTPTATTTYKITVSNTVLTATASAQVTIAIPAPVVTITAMPVAIQPGETSTLTWTTANTDAVTIDNGIGSVPLNGSIPVSPLQTTTYTITATGPGGTSSASASVQVIYPPPVVTLTAVPASIAPGAEATLSWSSANAAALSIDNGIGSVSTSGSIAVSPTLTTLYTITASGPGGTVTAAATITVVYPVPTVIIAANPPSVMPGQSSTLTWESTNATAAVINQQVVPVNGSLTVTPAEATTYTITVTGPGGTASASVTVTISPLRINFTSPAAGTTINRPDTMVEGTIVKIAGKETGLTVNGIPAFIDGNHFVVSHVPLVQGENTLTANAKDIDGNSASFSITVTADVNQKYINLTASSETGVAPLEILLSVDGSFPVTNPQLNFSGPGQVEFLSSSAEGFKVRMSTIGVYYFTASAVDETGTSYTDTVAVQVLDKTVLDTLLKSKWNGMKTALSVQDINKAVGFFHEDSRQKYQGIFSELSESLPQIVAEMQDIELIDFLQNGARYRIKRNESIQGSNYNISYYIYFCVDSDGIWRILGF